ncbi:MAG: hypothetical protein JO108_23935 [Acidobacteriaceae bacterium]|nr:hypothetical protein [Acidobacteriaceae bacterium]
MSKTGASTILLVRSKNEELMIAAPLRLVYLAIHMKVTSAHRACEPKLLPYGSLFTR